MDSQTARPEVVHLWLGDRCACSTGGRMTASPEVKQVNCKRCLKILQADMKDGLRYLIIYSDGTDAEAETYQDARDVIREALHPCSDESIQFSLNGRRADVVDSDGRAIEDAWAQVIDRQLEADLKEILEEPTQKRCPDCGEVDEIQGHQTCQYPSDVTR